MITKYALLGLIGISFILVGCGSEKGDSKETDVEPAVSVEVVKAVTGNITSYIHTTGTVYPWQEAYISPKIGGKIERIFVDEGDRVTEDQPLVQLEQTKLIIAQNEAQANLNTAAAELKKAEVSLENLKKTLKRMEDLHRQQVIDEQQYDSAKTEFLNAEAQLQLSKARVELAQAQLAHATQELIDSVVHAPFPGFVVEKIMNEGEMVYTVSPSKVLHITDIHKVKIECNIPEAKKQHISLGKEAVIEVDALPGERFAGNITTINPLVDPSSRTFLIKIEIENPSFRLESGMFARITIAEQEKKDVVIIPLKSIIEREGKRVLFTVVDNRAQMIPASVGVTDARNVEILSGLQEGELVVCEGFYALSDGAPVTIVSPQTDKRS